MSIIKVGTTPSKGFVVNSDSTGALQIKTGENELTALTISSDQVVSVNAVSKLIIPGGLPGQVLSTNGSGSLSWVNGSDGSSEVTVRTYKYIATLNQAVFTGDDSNGRPLVYVPSNLIVFEDGKHITNYIADDNVKIIFSSGRPLGTVIDVITFEPFKKADTVPASSGGHFNGSVTIRGSLSVTGKLIGNGSEITNLTNPQIVAALGYTPYNITNPSNYTTLEAVSTIGSASKLTTARNLSITGDLSWTSPLFDGTSSVSAIGTLRTTGVVPGTYRSVTTDEKGRITGGTNPTTLAGYGITDAQTKDDDLAAISALPDSGVGLLKKTGPNTWSLDNSAYITNVSTALGYIPYSAANPENFLNAATATTMFATKSEITTAVPSGVIAMWSGTTIPTGWKLCDGTNGTPDLRDKFIIGSSATKPIGLTEIKINAAPPTASTVVGPSPVAPGPFVTGPTQVVVGPFTESPFVAGPGPAITPAIEAAYNNYTVVNFGNGPFKAYHNTPEQEALVAAFQAAGGRYPP